MIDNLDEKAADEFLQSQTYGHLGCVLENGDPYVVPVNFLTDDDYIYIHSLPGRKLEALRENPKVCLQTEKIAGDGFEWKSVIAYGVFEEVHEKNKKTQILFEFYRKFPNFTPVEARFDDEKTLKSVSVFRIRIDRLTGVTEKY